MKFLKNSQLLADFTTLLDHRNRREPSTGGRVPVGNLPKSHNFQLNNYFSVSLRAVTLRSKTFQGLQNNFRKMFYYFLKILQHLADFTTLLNRKDPVNLL